MCSTSGFNLIFILPTLLHHYALPDKKEEVDVGNWEDITYFTAGLFVRDSILANSVVSKELFFRTQFSTSSGRIHLRYVRPRRNGPHHVQGNCSLGVAGRNVRVYLPIASFWYFCLQSKFRIYYAYSINVLDKLKGSSVVEARLVWRFHARGDFCILSTVVKQKNDRACVVTIVKISSCDDCSYKTHFGRKREDLLSPCVEVESEGFVSIKDIIEITHTQGCGHTMQCSRK